MNGTWLGDHPVMAEVAVYPLMPDAVVVNTPKQPSDVSTLT